MRKEMLANITDLHEEAKAAVVASPKPSRLAPADIQQLESSTGELDKIKFAVAKILGVKDLLDLRHSEAIEFDKVIVGLTLRRMRQPLRDGVIERAPTAGHTI